MESVRQFRYSNQYKWNIIYEKMLILPITLILNIKSSHNFVRVVLFFLCLRKRDKLFGHLYPSSIATCFVLYPCCKRWDLRSNIFWLRYVLKESDVHFKTAFSIVGWLQLSWVLSSLSRNIGFSCRRLSTSRYICCTLYTKGPQMAEMFRNKPIRKTLLCASRSELTN